eukprot:4924347-Pyramimonas_sp.AAC.1
MGACPPPIERHWCRTSSDCEGPRPCAQCLPTPRVWAGKPLPSPNWERSSRGPCWRQSLWYRHGPLRLPVAGNILEH